jgi:hypothetical protein
MFGRYYIRSRSSLTGKRVKKDPAFRKTMGYATLLAKASRIASVVYAVVLPQHKRHVLYRTLTGQAMGWLKYDWAEADIIEYLTQQYGGVRLPKEWPVTKLRPSYRRSKPPEARTAKSRVETIPVEPISFELYLWQQRQRQFRRLYLT